MGRFPVQRVLAVAVSFLAAVVLAGCGATPGESAVTAAASTFPAASSGPNATGGTGGPSGPGLEAATTLLKAAKLSDPLSLDALEGIRFTQTGTGAAAAVINGGASGDALWAATYVYASAAGSGSDAPDPAPLLAVAANGAASPSIRAMAGAGLLAAGRTEGFEALVAALGSAAAMDGSEPRSTIWEFAANTLERYTAAGFPEPARGDDAERTALVSQWTSWLATNAGHLRFDPATQLWVSA